MLGKKQSMSNESWIEAMDNIKSIVSEKDIKKLEKETVSKIKTAIKGKKSAYAWSGGKDSLVLASICQKAKIYDCMIGICNLEYTAFLDWISNNKPDNLQIVNTGQDIEWLSKHLSLLFPKDSNKAGRWFSIVQHTAQEKYFKEHNLDLMLLGRRKADGNFVGKDNAYTNLKGITRYSPLADWKHEHVLAYIAYNNIELPPIYSWSNGYKCGTHPWPARQHTGSTENGWREVYEIDSTIVIRASEKIESAKLFLEDLENEHS